MKLTAKARKAIKPKNFALPGRRYPIEDRSHAANALARVSQHGTPSEKAEVRAKVHEKYPTMGKQHEKPMKNGHRHNGPDEHLSPTASHFHKL